MIQQARKRKFQTAISNPSFEIWLLLHLLDLAKVLPDEAQRAVRFPHSDAVETELRRLLGAYNKRAVNPGDFINRVEEAMKHADKRQATSSGQWLASISRYASAASGRADPSHALS